MASPVQPNKGWVVTGTWHTVLTDAQAAEAAATTMEDTLTYRVPYGETGNSSEGDLQTVTLWECWRHVLGGNYAQLIGLPVLRAQGKHWLAIARHLQRGQPKMLRNAERCARQRLQSRVCAHSPTLSHTRVCTCIKPQAGSILSKTKDCTAALFVTHTATE